MLGDVRGDVRAAERNYSTGEAAKMCGISQQSIIRSFDSGALPGFRIPGSKSRRIPRSVLLAFMLANNIPVAPLGELSAEERAAVAAARKPPGQPAPPSAGA